ncbi:RNA polymerase factor sigma-54 [Chitinivorax sp. B]|uniref:RNA polymerase factor sigma-54 n=1 Tax=Chitinivorax sp. B TaxID=2502235 RepID=UPI0010F8DF49|nr:RNA polymerase factor sigma-54 [Chitinivorax sp. B]
MKQSLQLKLTQHLALTPQLQQSIKLLQLSTLDLNQEIERFLQENPMLERADEPEMHMPGEASDFSNGDSRTEVQNETAPTEERSASDEFASDDWGEINYSNTPRDDDDDSDYSQQTAEIPTLRDHLEDQLRLLPLETRDHALVSILIDNLGDDGLLSISLDEVLETLPEELEVEMEELRIALCYLQNLEPIGIGARTISECLMLQMAPMPTTPTVRLARQICERHLDLLAGKDYARLKKLLGCDEEALRSAQYLIRSLNPRPGAEFAQSDNRYIVPDVVVKQVKGAWVASLNSAAMPRLRVNRMYANILQQHRENGGSQLAMQLQEAKWLIKNVEQRFDTILRVSQAIVDRQYRFFEHGEVAMRPLVLRDIAEVLDLHESTISRVTTQKFMFTPRGIFELKYFFGSHVETEAGGECSAIAIKALIKQLVGNEDAKKPLSDSAISEVLAKQGINVARRTVAKYREAMQIPPVNQRKSL